jgi:hypothetical protein
MRIRNLLLFGIYVLDSRFFDSASLSLFVEIFL